MPRSPVPPSTGPATDCTPDRSTPDMPDRPAAAQPTEVDTTSATAGAPKLPHERDQSVPTTDPAPDPVMQQAHDDVQRGLVDIDARGSDGKPQGSRKPAGGH